jgi:hypothetical protein
MYEDDRRFILGLQGLEDNSVELPDFTRVRRNCHHNCRGGQGIKGSHLETSC